MTETMTARATPVAAGVTAYGVAAAIGLAGVGLQSAAFLNHDVAWVLWSSGRLLDGGTFGREIVAANPPLVWWVSALPMGLARLSGLSPLVCFYLFMAAVLSLSLMAAERLLRGMLAHGQRLFFLGAAALILGIGAGRDFGQREHLTAIAALPYILLVAARLGGDTPGRLMSALIGVTAAIGFAFKPHLLAVPLLLEALMLWRRGPRRALMRPELVAAALTIVAYVGAIAVFARPWLMEAAPAIAQVYWAFNVPDSMALVFNAMPSAATLALALLLAARQGWPTVPLLFVLAGAGFLAAGVLQWKAYSYHLYPVHVSGYLALVWLAISPGMARVIAAALLTWFTATSMVSLRDRMPMGETGADRAAMARFVNDNTPAGGRFLAFSTHPFPGFPTALHVHASWAPRTNSRLFLPAVVRLRAAPTGREDELAFAIAREREAALADMTPLPDLVLVDEQPVRHAILTLPFDYLAFYREDPSFAALWTNYEEISGAPEGYRAFRLWRGARP